MTTTVSITNVATGHGPISVHRHLLDNDDSLIAVIAEGETAENLALWDGAELVIREGAEAHDDAKQDDPVETAQDDPAATTQDKADDAPQDKIVNDDDLQDA